MTRRIDLNADLGEGCDGDAGLMTVVTSCNIACGGHAGDEASMRAALGLAKAHNVCAGAHPSFPDRENFGRTKMALSGPSLEAELIAQVTELKSIADQVGAPLTHLKPHGALYNMAAQNTDLAESLVTVLDTALPNAALFGPPGSQMQQVAAARGRAFIAEGFADRAYEADGQLRDRKLEGAVLHDQTAQVAQAIKIATHRKVTAYSGPLIDMPADTLCVHGDTPGAFQSAQAIKAALERAGLSICAPR